MKGTDRESLLSEEALIPENSLHEGRKFGLESSFLDVDVNISV